MATGTSVLMTEEDERWCIKCWVYLIVIAEPDERIYVTADATTRTQSVRKGVKDNLAVNAGDFKCFSYGIGSINNDVLFGFYNFQGNADLYIARRYEPSTPVSNAI